MNPANAHSTSTTVYRYFITDLDRPVGFLEVEAPTISRIAVHDGGKVVKFTHRPPLSPGDMPGTHVTRPEGICQ
jgi:hypothetical protein